jgi:hypothetical protein
MDPTKWIPFEKLSQRTRERIEIVYPYLKLDHCQFQDKESGVFMKAVNNVKIEKLLDPAGPETPETPEAKPAASTTRAKK